MLEAVVNVSEGRRGEVLAALRDSAGDCLLDVHTDRVHNRTVLTVAGADVEDAVLRVARVAVEMIDLAVHSGAHPRLGALDVVPFVPLVGSTMGEAIGARDRAASAIAGELAVPCFLYGPERPLPDVRRRAFFDLVPDAGPAAPHPTAGAACVGARPVLVAYNLWLAEGAVFEEVRAFVPGLRGEHVRALAFDMGGVVQVSFNLLAPERFGPARVFDAVAARFPVERAELVGLAPRSVLDAAPRRRWGELDLAEATTIEARLEQAGLDGGSKSGGK